MQFKPEVYFHLTPRTDAHWSFSMHQNPRLHLIVDDTWRKQSFKNVNVYIPESAAKSMCQGKEGNDLPGKKDRVHQWADLGLFDMLGQFAGVKQLQRLANR